MNYASGGEERGGNYANTSLGNQVSHNTTLSYFSFQINALRIFKNSFKMCFDGILVLKMKGVEP